MGLALPVDMSELGQQRPFSTANNNVRSTHDTKSLLDDGEPETIRWLDRVPEGEVLWDIGAKVGVYTIYGAVKRKLRVLAFEPGAASLATLTKKHRTQWIGAHRRCFLFGPIR